MHIVVLFSVHLRSASLQSARLEKDWSLASHSVNRSRCKWIGEFAATCLVWKFWIAKKPSDRTGRLVLWFYFVVLWVIHHDLNSELIHLDIQVKRFLYLMTNIIMI